MKSENVQAININEKTLAAAILIAIEGSNLTRIQYSKNTRSCVFKISYSSTRETDVKKICTSFRQKELIVNSYKLFKMLWHINGLMVLAKNDQIYDVKITARPTGYEPDIKL